MGAELGRLWRRVWRNPRHPKVREERIRALAAVCHNGGLALIFGAVAAPFLNPDLKPALWARIGFLMFGIGLILVGQVLLGYIPADETHHE